ncbi:hypothetical protein OY671_010830, partial [Metschnikowia pulcherrima]
SLDGSRRIAAGEAMASGVPQDRMPVVSVLDPYTRATFNPPAFSQRVLADMKRQFGDTGAVQMPPVMAGEDFGEFWRADPDRMGATIFWVGGRPASEPSGLRAQARIVTSRSASAPCGAVQCGLIWREIESASDERTSGPSVAAGGVCAVPGVVAPATPLRKSSPTKSPPA